MKKILFLFFVFLIGSLQSFCQNLVPNPSFEDTASCPDNFGQVSRSFGWSSFGNTPDFFYSCSPDSTVGVPDNNLGHQFPETGNGYCGFLTYLPTDNYREYIGTQLIMRLEVGVKYYVSFSVSRANIQGYNAASNKMGILFSTVPYSEYVPAPVNNFDHIHSNAMVLDSVNWTRVSGSFIADSAYKYAIAGNFYDYVHTSTSSTSMYSYYYIDDICVSRDSLPCFGINAIFENNLSNSISLFPNPTSTNLQLLISNWQSEKMQIEIFDVLGKINFTSSINHQTSTIDVSGFPSGVYYLKISSQENSAVKKFVKM